MNRLRKFLWFLLSSALALLSAGNLSGLTWHWSNPMPFGNDVADMTCYNGLTVQVTDSGQLYTTDDLSLWLAATTGTSNALQAVAYFGSRMVVVGANGTVVYSDNGANFTYTNVVTPNSDWLVGVAASSNLVVAVGDEAVIYTSTDGANWTRDTKANTPPGVGANWLRGVAYGNGLFVTVGEGGYIASSPDGTNWTQRTSGIANDLNWVRWVSTPASTNSFATPSFIAVGNSGSTLTGTNALISTNGINWSMQDMYVIANVTNVDSLYGVAGDSDSRLMAGDNRLPLETSPATFNDQIGLLPGTAPSWIYYSALAETNIYLAAGEAGATIQGMVDTNGNYTWESLDDSSRSWLWSVTTVSNLYVAVGDQARVMTSGDGVDWSIEAIPYTNTVSATNTVFFGVGGSSNLLIAVGSGGTTVLSTNTLVPAVTTNSDGSLSTNLVSTLGIIWNPIPPTTTNDLHGVAFFNNQYYISGGTGTILKSPDGLNWTADRTPTTAYISGMEVFSGGMVAVGDGGTILTSPDGNTWTARASGTTNWIYHVRNLGGTLVAVGENGVILTSTNGTVWSVRASGTTAWLNDVTLVTNSFYIVGNYGTVLTSTNATAWTSIGTITGNSLYGAATQNGQLLAVGLDGAILRSQIVPVLTPVQFLSYSQADGQNLFLVAGQTDQEFTLDSSSDLSHWTTGPLLQITSDDGTLLFYISNGSGSAAATYYRATLVIPE